MAWKRITVTDELCKTERRHNNFTLADIHKYAPGILPTDCVKIKHDEGYESDNNSWDPSYTLIVTRTRDATDEEMAKFVQSLEERKAKSKFERYEYFLQLKGEFDGLPAPDEPIWDKEEEQERRRNNNKR